MSEDSQRRKPAGTGKPRAARAAGGAAGKPAAKRPRKAKSATAEVAATPAPAAPSLPAEAPSAESLVAERPAPVAETPTPAATQIITGAAPDDVPAIPEPPALATSSGSSSGSSIGVGTINMRLRQRTGRRYSRFVGAMKVALPVAALGLIAAVIAWPGGDISRPGALPISFANIKLDPTGLTMKSPRFVGVDTQGQAYSVTADEAVQDKADAERVDLTNPEAEITLKDRGWFHLQSETGVIHPKTNTIELHGDVSLYSSEGWEAHGSAVTANMEEGTARSDQPVTGQGPVGTLSADRFEAWDGGHNIRFLGNVRMTVMPSARS